MSLLGPMVVLAVLIPLLVLFYVGREFLRAALDSSEARPVEFATPSRISEASYMLVSPPAELGTYAAAIEHLPPHVVAAVEAFAPCPENGARHIWLSETVEIMQFGKLQPVRRESFVKCENCGLAISPQLHRELHRLIPVER